MYTTPLKDAEVAINDGLRSVVKIKVNPKLYIPTKDIIKVMLRPFN